MFRFGKARTAMSAPAKPASSSASASPASGTTAPTGPATGTRPGLVLLLSAGTTFIAFLDTTVVNVAFPDLAESFPGDRVSDLSRVVSSYAVLFAALLTPAGRITDAFGRKRVFLLSIAGFTVASALCATAPNLPWLITARALQGAAAAGMIPAALGLLLATTPAAGLAAAIGVWGAAGSMATAAGPALGGRAGQRLRLALGLPHQRAGRHPPGGGRYTRPAGTRRHRPAAARPLGHTRRHLGHRPARPGAHQGQRLGLGLHGDPRQHGRRRTTGLPGAGAVHPPGGARRRDRPVPQPHLRGGLGERILRGAPGGE
jgi:hypothetical protein